MDGLGGQPTHQKTSEILPYYLYALNDKTKYSARLTKCNSENLGHLVILAKNAEYKPSETLWLTVF